MNKQLTISDIDFIEPDQDQQYSDNVLKNLLGNYFFRLQKQYPEYFWFPQYSLSQEPIGNEKWSIAEKKDHISFIKPSELTANQIIGPFQNLEKKNKYSSQELYKFRILMPKWESFFNEAFGTSWFNQNKQNVIGITNKLENDVNNFLSSLYFFQLSNNINQVLKIDQVLVEGYGKYFYDYSFSMSVPQVLSKEVTQQQIDNSNTVVPIAKIESLYNYYSPNFEEVSNSSQENTLYNFYTLHYYLLDQFKNDSFKNGFLNLSVLPLLQNYQEFITDYISSIPKKDNILKKLEEYKKLNIPTVQKKTVLIAPDSLNNINDLNTLKNVQPFGVDISFPPQTKKILNTLLEKTDSVADLQTKVVKYSSQIDGVLQDKVFSVSIATNQNDEIINTANADVPVISLNEWIKNLEPEKFPVTAPFETIVLSKNEADQDSIFLQKIKKFLLQKKIDELIELKRRSYSDIVNGVPAYNEVLLYEIRKYDFNNQLIQKILIPNTQELDFYKYFDTQIKYDKDYSYEVLAWTIIIGNKYKYFDRLVIPTPSKLYKYKNNTSEKNLDGDSILFRWFKILHTLTKLDYNDGQSINDFMKNNDAYFSGFTNFEAQLTGKKIKTGDSVFKDIKGIGINFSNLLDNSYSTNIINNEYKKIEAIRQDQSDQAQKIITEISTKVKEQVSNLFANLFFVALLQEFNIKANSNQLGNDKTQQQKQQEFALAFQTSLITNQDNPTSQTGITTPNPSSFITQAKTIQKKDSANYYFKKYNISQREFLLEIVNLFKDVGLLSNIINDLKSALVDSFFKIKEQGSAQVPENVKSEIVKNIKNVLLKGFIKINPFSNNPNNPNGLLDGAFFFEGSVDVDLNNEPNYGLSRNDTWYPRFKVNANSKQVNAEISVGVYNQVDVILAGLPYVEKTTTKAVSAPPPPPDVVPVPFKNVKNKIKFFVNDSFFTYRDYPIQVLNTDKEKYDKLLEIEKQNGKDDGKITFSGDEPSTGFDIYRIDFVPQSYEDFSLGQKFTIPNKGGFIDTIEPNKKYYYVFRSFEQHQNISNPSAIYEVEIVENSGAIYPIIRNIEITKEDGREKIKSFKNEFKIKVNQEHILENKDILSAKDIDLSKFGSLTPSVFGNNFKIRITSKSTKKKLDLNIIFERSIDKKYLAFIIEQQKKEKQQKAQKIKA